MPRIGHSPPDVALPVLSRAEGSYLDLLSTLCLTQPKIPITFSVARAHYWHMFNLVPVRTPRPYSAKVFPNWALQHVLVPGIALHQVQDLNCFIHVSGIGWVYPEPSSHGVREVHQEGMGAHSPAVATVGPSRQMVEDDLSVSQFL